MVSTFESTFQMLEAWGIADTLLPFILIFAIVFAVLDKAQIFGENKRNINIIIALVIGLSVVIPHVTNSYPPEADVVDLMNIILPQVSLVAVAFLMVLILVGVVGGEWMGSHTGGWMAMIGAIAVFIIFGGAVGWWESGWLYNTFGEETVSVALMLLVFGLIIWFITREGKATGGEGLTKFMKDFGNFWTGKK